jgi:hypothetical protein
MAVLALKGLGEALSKLGAYCCGDIAHFCQPRCQNTSLTCCARSAMRVVSRPLAAV